MRLLNAIQEGLLCHKDARYDSNMYREIPGAMMNLLVASIALGLIAFLGSQGVFQGMGDQTIRTLTYVSLGGVALFGLLYNVRCCCNKMQAYTQRENRRWLNAANALAVPAVDRLDSALPVSLPSSQILSTHSHAYAAEPEDGQGVVDEEEVEDGLTRSASTMPHYSQAGVPVLGNLGSMPVIAVAGRMGGRPLSRPTYNSSSHGLPRGQRHV